MSLSEKGNCLPMETERGGCKVTPSPLPSANRYSAGSHVSKIQKVAPKWTWILNEFNSWLNLKKSYTILFKQYVLKCVLNNRSRQYTPSVQNLTINAFPHLSAYINSGTEVGGVGGLKKIVAKQKSKATNECQSLHIRIITDSSMNVL